MTSILDTVTFANMEDQSGERFVLSRKHGKLAIRAKSPLFEAHFKELSKGRLTGSDPYWGIPLYDLRFDQNLSKELLSDGIAFSLNASWARNSYDRGGAPILVNFGFLLAPGLGEGITLPIKDSIPYSIIEGPNYTFSNTLKRGLYQLLRQYVLDYEVNIHIKVDQKV